MEQNPDTYSYTACHIGCSSLLDEVRPTPARALITAPPVFQPGL